MANIIRFNYLYRDSGNYKKFAHKDFENSNDLPIETVEQQIRSQLFDTEYFYPDEVGIVKFRFHRYCDFKPWYEMENIGIVNRPCKRKLTSISEFIKMLKTMKEK